MARETTSTLTIQPGFKALKANRLSCGDCGIALRPSKQYGPVFEVEAAQVDNEDGIQLPPDAPRLRFHRVTRFRRCKACYDRHQKALAVFEEWPAGRILRTDNWTAWQQVLSAFIAFGVVGATVEITSARDLKLLVRSFNFPIKLLRWSSYYEGHLALGASVGGTDPDRAPSTPWRWVTDETRHKITEAWFAYRSLSKNLRASVQHPDGAGCWICGLATVDAPLHRRDEAWVELAFIPNDVGGRGTEPTKQWVCAHCEHGIPEHYALSSGIILDLALEEAGLFGHHVTELVNIPAPAWGLVDGRAPSETRFAHLDVATLKERVYATAIQAGAERIYG